MASPYICKSCQYSPSPLLTQKQSRELHSPQTAIQLRSHAGGSSRLRHHAPRRRRETIVLDAHRQRRGHLPGNPHAPESAPRERLCPTFQQMSVDLVPTIPIPITNPHQPGSRRLLTYRRLTTGVASAVPTTGAEEVDIKGRTVNDLNSFRKRVRSLPSPKSTNQSPPN